MANTGKGRKPIKPGAGQRIVDGKDFRLADEVRYILGRAAEHDVRVITIGQIILFSTETGDAWLIEPSDQLAARLARDGDPEPFHSKKTRPPSRLTGRGAIASRETHSSTWIEKPGGSPRSTAIQRHCCPVKC
jgi:hypothetical protein